MQVQTLKSIISDTHKTVWLYRFDSEGFGRRDIVEAEHLPSLDPALLENENDFFWLHIDLVDTRARHWVAGLEFVPEVLRQRFLSSTGRRTAVCEENVISYSLPDTVLNFDVPNDEMAYLHCLLGDRFLITGRRKKITVTADVIEAVENHTPITSALELSARMLDKIVIRLENIGGDNTDDLDEIEDRVLAERMSHDTTKMLGALRRTLAYNHRPILQLQQVVHQIERNESFSKPRRRQRAFRSLGERLDALDHDIVSELGRAKILQDEIAARLASDANQNLYAISLMTAFFMPPALVAGIFGMNVADLPLEQTHSGFWWTMALLGLSTLIAYVLVRFLIHNKN